MLLIPFPSAIGAHRPNVSLHPLVLAVVVASELSAAAPMLAYWRPSPVAALLPVYFSIIGRWKRTNKNSPPSCAL